MSKSRSGPPSKNRLSFSFDVLRTKKLASACAELYALTGDKDMELMGAQFESRLTRVELAPTIPEAAE